MRIGELFAGLDVRVPPGLGTTRVSALTEDSRSLTPGCLFIARKGEKTDGRRFARQAIEAGAAAVLSDDPAIDLPAPGPLIVAANLPVAIAHIAERFHGHPSTRLRLIGITGTNGKTTTAYLVHQMLNALGVRCGLIGTVTIDDGSGERKAVLTTPPALETSRSLARMLDAGCQAAVMEVSSHALHQQRVGALRFAAGVFTNLTHDHLDYHKTMDAYGDAKSMLFEMLPESGAAILNIMDPAHSRLVRDCKARIVRCAIEEPLSTRTAGVGTAPQSLRTARITGTTTSYTDIELGGGWARHGRPTVRLPLVGAFNVMNALEALAAAYELFGPASRADLSFDALLAALGRVKAPPGRLEPVTPSGHPFTVLVDYAHTDDALRTVLGVLRGALDERGRLICVFGCGGDRDRTKRPKMGSVSASLADRLIITSDNPRTENPDAIIREIQAGLPSGASERTTIEPDREAAIQLAIRSAAPGDTILIAGKGHEDYQILPDPANPGATIRRHFDDRDVAREALTTRVETPSTILSPA